ncbi:hypothetical protein BG005_003994 [Podila minutissima]|nr:hypothetical protein BG005_003994 [Podila minutissima]
MTDNHLTLFCLVDGDSLSEAFEVEISSTKTVSALKKAIRDENTVDFAEIDARLLTLWRVSVPADYRSRLRSIYALDNKTELDEPRTPLSQLFPDNPDENTYIIVQRPPQGPGTTATHPSISVTPTVRFWEGFKDSVRGMELDPIPRYPPPQFKEDRLFIPEISLQELFLHDLGTVKLLPPFAKTIRIMGLPHGIPDLVCMREGSKTDEPESILFPIEIRRPIVLQSRNLVTDYNEQGQSGAARGPARALKQTFGYMRLNGYRYGVLSTYEQTWFLKRVARGSNDILVSPTIDFDITEPTLLQCYLWIKITTRSDSKKTTRVVLPAFDSMELISYDERAQTYKASWQGVKVVVKKCDIWNQGPVVEELKHEARVYQVLQTLQGRYIPELRIAGVADGMEMMLVTNFVGSDISHERLDDSDQEKIRAALSAIHDLGVVHGDIRPQNVLVQHDGPNARFYLVDFGLSRITADKTELLQETAVLNSLLRNIATAR